MKGSDYGLEALLALDGYEARFPGGYKYKFEARTVEPTVGQPAGIKYSLSLHDPQNESIYRMDNAHGVKRGKAYDHRHCYGRGRRSSPTRTGMRRRCWTISTGRQSES